MDPDSRFVHDSGDTIDRDGASRLIRAVTGEPKSCVTYTYEIVASPPAFSFEHDKQKRLFMITHEDGKTEHFRDNPARHLMVEPDPVTGEMKPVTKHGKPVCVYLCREEREA
jgi:hypothetical protein